MKTPTICVLGSVNLDLIIQTKTLPRAGETIAGGHFLSLPGGKGANVALAAQRLGAAVELRAAIGNDDYAVQALGFLKEEGVDLSGLVSVTGSHTGLAFINVSSDGENQIAVASGANAEFTPEKLSPIKTGAIITQFEIPLETIKAAIKNYEGFVSLNASPVTNGLSELTAYTDLIIVNAGEYDAYKTVLDNYEGLLAVTHGGDGASLFQNGETLATSKPPVINVVDTTGAGDCFAGALTVALIEGKSPQEALDFACIAGALTTTKMGTQSASPKRAEVNALLA
ncbi:MAG: ribokinase [Maricaulaceae bacterium]